MKTLSTLLRPNIAALTPYSSARDEYTGAAAVFLDANENPYNAPYNRYPDPYQQELKKEIAKIKGISVENIFLGNGSDEPIDLLFRAFCEPGIDNTVAITPSYGMYQVAAEINNVKINKVLLTPDYQLDIDGLIKAEDANSKLLFLCSPNNPTGNCFPQEEIIKVIENFEGIVVLDEAYIDFAPDQSFLSKLLTYPNLVILQTFSKAWGMAGLRLGMAFASKEITSILSRIKYPYNLNILTQQKALELIKNTQQKEEWVELLINERQKTVENLKKLNFVKKIYPSDANFVLIKTDNAKSIYNYLVSEKIIIRDRSKVDLCEGCLRITIGTPEENSELILKLQQYPTA